jgi:hypothetical protein
MLTTFEGKVIETCGFRSWAEHDMAGDTMK